MCEPDFKNQSIEQVLRAFASASYPTSLSDMEIYDLAKYIYCSPGAEFVRGTYNKWAGIAPEESFFDAAARRFGGLQP